MLNYFVDFSGKSYVCKGIARHAAERTCILIHWYVLLFHCNKNIEPSIQFTFSRFQGIKSVLESMLNVLIIDEREGIVMVVVKTSI